MKRPKEWYLAGVLGLVLALMCVAVPAGRAAEPAAQKTASPTGAGQPLSTEDLKTLVNTLENDVERQKFIAELKALIAAREQAEALPPSAAQAPTASASASQPPATQAPPSQNVGARVIADVSERIQEASSAIANAASAAIDLPHLLDSIKRQATEGQNRVAWLDLFLKLAIVLALAVVADWLTGLALRRPSRAVRDRPSDSTWLRAVFLLEHIVIELVPIVAFGAVAYSALPFVKPDALARLMTLAIVNAIVVVRAVLAITRLVLAPQGEQHRLLAMSDETAGYWYVWLRRLVSLVVYGYFAAEAATLVGLSPAGYQFLTKLIGLATAALLVILILQNRQAVARWIRGSTPAGIPSSGLQVLRARLANIWHVLALLYIIASYAVWALRISGGFDFVLRASVLTIVILVVAKASADGVGSLLHRFFSVGADLKRRFPALEARAGRYLPVLIGAVRALIYLVALIALLQAWGLGTFGWLASDIGRQIISSLASILLTVVITLIVWEAITISSEVYLARKMAEGRRTRRQMRAYTLLPLLRKTVAILLAAIAGLIVLSALGVDIGPLLAGMGVAGIAVGLGAQSLIKDLITGLFIVIDDTIAVGDVVDLGGGNAGLVEAISIRAIRLRDQSGTVYTIPFSAVTSFKNLTKDFSYALFDIAVDYREDVDEVIEVIKQLGAEVKKDPHFGPLILEPLEMIGLDRFEHSAVIIKARIKTLPIQQWNVMREFNRRLKHRFDELGIEIPFPHQTLYFGADKKGQAPPLHIAVESGAVEALPEHFSHADSKEGEEGSPKKANKTNETGA